MTTLRTALRSAIETGDVGPLTAAGFAELSLDDVRDALAALADQEPAAIGAAIDAAASETDVASVLGAARSALASTAGPAPLGANLIAGADPSADLDFAPWQAPGSTTTAEPSAVESDVDAFGDDLDFGSGGEAPADPELLHDVPDDAVAPLSVLDDESFVTEAQPDADPFAIGATDLDELEQPDDEGGDDFF